MSEHRRLTSDSSDGTTDTDISTMSIDHQALHDANAYRETLYSPGNTFSISDHVPVSEIKGSTEHLHQYGVLDRLRKIFEGPKRHVEDRKKRLQKEETEKKERLSLFHAPRTVHNEAYQNQRMPVAPGYARECLNIESTDEATGSFEDSQSEFRGKYAQNLEENYSKSKIPLERILSHPCYCFTQFDTEIKHFNRPNSEQSISCKCQTELKNKGKAISGMHGSASHTETKITKSTDTGTETIPYAAKNMGSKLTNTRDENIKAITERDTLIHQFQEKNMQSFVDAEAVGFLKLRKNYNNLKKLFVALAIVNIILIICVVSVLPVILVTFKLSYYHEVKSDDDIKQIVSEHLSSNNWIASSSVYCVSCRNLDQTLSKFFTERQDKRCCIEDISKVFTVFTNLTDQKNDECHSRLNNLEEDHDEMLSHIINLKMKLFNTSELDVNEDWLKHPGIQKNNRLINMFLTRQHSAIHLKGAVKKDDIKWTADISEGKLWHNDNGISVENGGMYYVYSIIRYKKNTCGSNGKFGYEVKRRTGIGSAVRIASVYNDCTNGTHYDQDLVIQRVFQLSVGQNSEVFIDIGEFCHNLVVEEDIHSFGIFEL
ncbi:uncharacterized protein LOC123553887 [Mercenaria mercenaria]|uniref:uncharacterized protein LOC123553887 n=1 Tax=Mercenaria mercenaria TaxID=6596 RepID=UPI00234ECA34|nr:uncharacterized protein LOC123553887 [Mercenaria mercenaria]XP_053404713.1 uncharacterized protein LOC123553887 [Mercenaria mercenaria]